MFSVKQEKNNFSDKFSELLVQFDVYIVIYFYKLEMRFFIYMGEISRLQFGVIFYIQVYLLFMDNWYFGGLKFDGY